MTTDPNSILQEVYKTYCTLTSTTPNQAIWERDIYEFIQAGYTKDDLSCVLIWIMRENKKASESRYHKKVSPIKIFGDLRQFDSWLVEARAIERNHKPSSPKAKVLESFRGFSDADTKVCARRIGEVLNGMSKT